MQTASRVACILLLLPTMLVAQDARPSRDTQLPVYPVEASFCTKLKNSPVVVQGLIVEPFTIPGIVPENGQRVYVEVVPNTSFWRFLFDHSVAIDEHPVALPSAENCIFMGRFANGVFTLPGLAVGDYFVRVIRQQPRTIELGGGSHSETKMVVTPEGPGFVNLDVPNGPPSNFNYTVTTQWVRPISIYADPKRSNTWDLDHWVQLNH